MKFDLKVTVNPILDASFLCLIFGVNLNPFFSKKAE